MEATIKEWLHLLFRWVHIIAGIMWIGNSMFFHWLDKHMRPVEGERGGVGTTEGELWMVHSGGFYEVLKKRVALERLPDVLHWFKWEAAFTWLSGIFLLCLVYYMGGAVYLVDASVSSIRPAAAIHLGLGLLVVSWVVYDLLVRSPLWRAGGALWGFLLVLGVAYGLSRVLSGRGAFIHVGAMMGTIMVANVWMRIIPAQRHLVEATRAGRAPDAALAIRAKQRSTHNHYMTFPLIFIMLSNHFPNTYGSKWSWLILGALMLGGAGVRYFMNMRDRSPYLLLGLMGAAAVLMVGASVAGPRQAATQGTEAAGPGAGAGPASAAAEGISGASLGGLPAPPRSAHGKVGSIHAVVQFTGAPPPPHDVGLPAGCGGMDARVMKEQVVQVKDGRLRDAFVFISQGVPDGLLGDTAGGDVVIDQRGCVYAPRVVGARVGQRVTFLNSDPILHNVRAVAEKNATWNELTQSAQRLTKTFDKPEIMVHSKCDFHPWMNAYIGVLPHSYFAVSNERGEVLLGNVPAGEVTIDAWHEVYGRKSQKVTVPDGGRAEATFTFP